jgi:UDP-glucose 4-epimerase
LLAEVNGKAEFRLKQFPGERKAIDIGDYYANYCCISNVLGWQPKVPIKEGLEQTIGYYREHLQKYL